MLKKWWDIIGAVIFGFQGLIFLLYLTHRLIQGLGDTFDEIRVWSAIVMLVYVFINGLAYLNHQEKIKGAGDGR